MNFPTHAERTGTHHLARAKFEAEVAGRLGVLPNFFRTAEEAPGLIDKLWAFAKSAYLDNPLPSIFKERLFVHLSRFCPVRYCIIRHVGFLIGLGRPAGDAAAPPQTLEQVVQLLRQPGLLDEDELASVLARLSARPLAAMPEPESQAERDIFAAAAWLFVQPIRAVEARQALHIALGGTKLELLTAYLAFIRTAHYWTMTHPELAVEEDMTGVMQAHDVLAAMLLDESEGAHCEMAPRLYDELLHLRREHDDRVALREALAERERVQRQQQLLIRELNHRVKNTLAVVQSLAMQSLRGPDVPAAARDAFTGRLMALARTHDLLTRDNWEGADLQEVIAEAIGVYCAEDDGRVRLQGPPVQLAPKTAVAMAMVFQELGTNATKYGALSIPEGRVEVSWNAVAEDGATRLSLRWAEIGGPPVKAPERRGFGTRLIERGLSAELHGRATISFEPTGAVAEIEALLAQDIDPPMAAARSGMEVGD